MTTRRGAAEEIRAAEDRGGQPADEIQPHYATPAVPRMVGESVRTLSHSWRTKPWASEKGADAEGVFAENGPARDG